MKSSYRPGELVPVSSLAEAEALRLTLQEPVQCSRCNLPLDECAGHGSSPESEDNQAEEVVCP